MYVTGHKPNGYQVTSNPLELRILPVLPEGETGVLIMGTSVPIYMFLSRELLGLPGYLNGIYTFIFYNIYIKMLHVSAV